MRITAATYGEDGMIGHSSPRSLWLAGAFLGISTLVATAQQAAQPLPPGSPLIGRPESEAFADGDVGRARIDEHVGPNPRRIDTVRTASDQRRRQTNVCLLRSNSAESL